MYSASYLNLRVLKLCFGGLSPPKAPVVTDRPFHLGEYSEEQRHVKGLLLTKQGIKALRIFGNWNDGTIYSRYDGCKNL